MTKFILPLIALTAAFNISNSTHAADVTLTGNPLWVDTGLTVSAGQVVVVTAKGIWTWDGAEQAWGNSGHFCGPDGVYDQTQDTFVKNGMHGQLIAYTGAHDLTADPFFNTPEPGAFFAAVGSAGMFAIPSGHAGKLWLGMNDDADSKDVGDNCGSISAHIIVGYSGSTPPSSPPPPPPVLAVNSIGEAFSFSITAPPGSVWNIYSSDDLISWTLIDGISISEQATASFADENISNVKHRFYKLANQTTCSQAIGFVRIDIDPQMPKLVANQFDHPCNGSSLNKLFNPMPDGSLLPDGTRIGKWNQADNSLHYTYWDLASQTWSSDGFIDGNATLAPGEGAYIITPTNANPVTITFVGTVLEGGTLNVSGKNIYSSIIPQSGGVTSLLQYPPNAYDEVFIYRNGYSGFVFDPDDLVWTPSEPTLKIGEAFWIQPAVNKPWTRAFSSCSTPAPCAPELTAVSVDSLQGTFRFDIAGLPGSTWQVQSTGDFGQWNLLELVTLSATGTASFTDSPGDGAAYAFYKLKNNDGCCSRAVGFLQIDAQPGDIKLIANHFETPGDHYTLNDLFNPMVNGQHLANGTKIGKWIQADNAIHYATWDDVNQVWISDGTVDGSATLAPGEGARLQVPTNATPRTIAFAGLVKEGGTISVSGKNLYSSLVPQSGGITSSLQYAPNPNDVIFVYRDGFSGFEFDPDDLIWYPSEPIPYVGESFWIQPAQATVWSRAFSVCP